MLVLNDSFILRFADFEEMHPRFAVKKGFDVKNMNNQLCYIALQGKLASCYFSHHEVSDNFICVRDCPLAENLCSVDKSVLRIKINYANRIELERTKKFFLKAVRFSVVPAETARLCKTC